MRRPSERRCPYQKQPAYLLPFEHKELLPLPDLGGPVELLAAVHLTERRNQRPECQIFGMAEMQLAGPYPSHCDTNPSLLVKLA